MSTQCMIPFKLKDADALVPCGKCHNCKRRLASSWSLRVVEESKLAHSAVFLTLTYNNDHLPISKLGYQTLVKKDLQDFFKRLRKAHKADHKTLRYFAVGEYGGITKRPHYHIILFNANYLLVESAWSFQHIEHQPKYHNKTGRLLKSTTKVKTLKEIGYVHYGFDVHEEAAGYTVKYISKTCYIGKNQKIDDRQPNFRLMSKGIGKNYITEKMTAWHKNNPTERVYVPLKGGKKAPMPRYYKDKIFNESEKEKIAQHFQNNASISLQKEIEEHGFNHSSFKKQQYLDGNRKMLLNKNNKI